MGERSAYLTGGQLRAQNTMTFNDATKYGCYHWPGQEVPSKSQALNSNYAGYREQILQERRLDTHKEKVLKSPARVVDSIAVLAVFRQLSAVVSTP